MAAYICVRAQVEFQGFGTAPNGDITLNYLHEGQALRTNTYIYIYIHNITILICIYIYTYIYHVDIPY